jgi:hypothetical protein
LKRFVKSLDTIISYSFKTISIGGFFKEQIFSEHINPDPDDRSFTSSASGSGLDGFDSDSHSGIHIGSGIHIHIKDSVLNSLLDKVPWTDVFETFNNRLTRTEEVKHIKEHIYKSGNEEKVINHKGWDDWKSGLDKFRHVGTVRRRPPPRLQRRSEAAKWRSEELRCQQHYQYVSASQWNYYCNTATGRGLRSGSQTLPQFHPRQQAVTPQPPPPQIYHKTWQRQVSPTNEYTFRHTIIKKVEKPGFNRLPRRHHHGYY